MLQTIFYYQENERFQIPQISIKNCNDEKDFETFLQCPVSRTTPRTKLIHSDMQINNQWISYHLRV